MILMRLKTAFHAVRRTRALRAIALPALFFACMIAAAMGDWPPALPGAVNGTVTLTDEGFLNVPAEIEELRRHKAAIGFSVAQSPPRVELAYHGDLPHSALNPTGWSSWGDIAVASDGRVYSGIGDHGDDAGGNAQALLYVWEPDERTLRQVVDLNRIGPRRPGQPAWSKVHARIDEGSDGGIYFSGTLNDGTQAVRPQYKWNEDMPGGRLYRYDPRSGKAQVFAELPPQCCTPTSLLDRERNIWWCSLEGACNALWAIDLESREVVFRAPEGSLGLNRNFALAADGSIYFNAPDGRIRRYDPALGGVVDTESAFQNPPGMRASTRESRNGTIYGVTHASYELFRYHPRRDELEIIGSTFLTGAYVTVIVMSPCERFLYYLPGAHGNAVRLGTPVIQYGLEDGNHKVIAFLRDVFKKRLGYVPGGTYGIKMNEDGSRLYVNFNGHAAENLRLPGMRPTGFGLTAFAVIHIPESER